MHTRTIFSRREGIHSEVPRLNCIRDVGPPDAAPPGQIVRWDQDSTVGAAPATSTATQAIELLEHVAAYDPDGALPPGGLRCASVI